MAARTLPPGPKGHFLRGHLPELGRDPLGFLRLCAREYGDFVPLQFGPTRAVLLNHPAFIEYVLVTHHRIFVKGPVVRDLRQLLGNGLVTSDGDLWLRQRRLAQPAFHRERIAALGEVMVTSTQRMLATWKDGETRDISRELSRLTLTNVATTLFGVDIAGAADEVATTLAIAREQSEARLTSSLSLLLSRFPTPGNLRLRSALRRLDALIEGIIQQRRASGEERNDLLTLLLQAQAADGSRLSDRQLRDEAKTFLLAGHDTTALTLSWIWYLLSQHPEVEAKLLAELQTVLGGRGPSVADLSQLQYTERIVSEALRLYPPSWALARAAVRDCEIGGYEVPAGTILMMSQWVMQRDFRYFDCPERFDPDRWADGLPQSLPKYAYFPFGAGPRLCIGNTFALIQTRLLLVTIAQQFRLSLVPGHPVTPQPDIVLRPRYGVQMILHYH